MTKSEGMTANLLEASAWAREWLFSDALPLWWSAGADHLNGGFFEKLDQEGRPVGVPTRVRVQARQLYVFAEAGRLGWSGPWQEAIQHALTFMLDRYPRSDGLFRSTLDTSDTKIDLYDQAFVLFAMAHAYRQQRDSIFLDTAIKLIDRLDSQLAHPDGGYEEANPRQLPLRSNPQMHLLEALLAWVESGVQYPFSNRAKAIVNLAVSKLIDPSTGAIGEYFDGDWCFAAGADGRMREPGHQFEWAYLLNISDQILGSSTFEASRLLERFGRLHGVNSASKASIFAVDESGSVLDGKARLWAQTERLRTSLVLAQTASGVERETLLQSAHESVLVVRRFLATPKPGLWWEWMEEDGSFRNEPSPASSLYHLMTGLTELVQPQTAVAR